MDERRLIDANVLLAWIDNLEALNLARRSDWLIPKGLSPDGMRHMVNRMPTEDAVEVVRCKDCKHRKRYYCFHPEQMYLAVDIDYYCARGERRES